MRIHNFKKVPLVFLLFMAFFSGPSIYHSYWTRQLLTIPESSHSSRLDSWRIGPDEKFRNLSFIQPAYNKEVEFLRHNSFSFSLSGIDLEELTTDQLRLTTHSYLETTNILCHRLIRLGKLGDGGWEVCDDPDVSPTPPCIVYSFGINNDWSFDDDMARIYGCHVFSFDPSMNVSAHNRSNLIHFYDIGIWGSNFVNEKHWRLYTFNDIRAMLGHQNMRIDIIKMDVETAEWRVIPDMLQTNALHGVKQLLIEYHTASRPSSRVLAHLKAIQGLEEAGFKKFYVHKNSHTKRNVEMYPVRRSGCYEVHYMRP